MKDEKPTDSGYMDMMDEGMDEGDPPPRSAMPCTHFRGFDNEVCGRRGGAACVNGCEVCPECWAAMEQDSHGCPIERSRRSRRAGIRITMPQNYGIGDPDRIAREMAEKVKAMQQDPYLLARGVEMDMPGATDAELRRHLMDKGMGDPDRVVMEMPMGVVAGNLLEATGQLRRSFTADMRSNPSVGSAAAIVEVVNQVKPCGIRLVGVVLQGRPTTWWWRWAEPVALWLLKRAGMEVCR